MNSRAPSPLTAAPAALLDAARTDLPVSEMFGDVYFSADNGLEETRQVYLKACGMPKAWAGRERFTIGELGFGSGLNFLAALEMWRACRPSQTARLHFVSIEGFPFDKEQLSVALSGWPELSDISAELIGAWPGRVRGIHRLEFKGGVSLTLCFDDVRAALSDVSFSANAWFLDGFSPAKNPDMWAPDVMQSVFDLSAPGANIGTFTVAGDVRRALTAAGFEVQKLPGFGRKRHRLEAKKPGAQAKKPQTVRPVIIGAGIAGASLARSFLMRGITPVIIDPDDDSAASGNMAAVIKPRLDLQDRPESRFFLAAYLYACAAYAGANVRNTGVAQIAKTQTANRRFEKLTNQAVLPASDMEPVSAELMQQRTGLEAVTGGLWFSRAQAIDPRGIIADWTQDATVLCGRAARLERAETDIKIIDSKGKTLASGTHIYICAGAEIETLLDTETLKAGFIPGYQRGQVTLCKAVKDLPAPVNYGGYAIPCAGDILLGATHERGNKDVSGAVQAGDDSENISVFESAGGTAGSIIKSRASVRVTTPDSIPRAGQLAPGISVFTGLGGRGFVHAPLIAEALVSDICNDPLPVSPKIMVLLSPGPGQ